MTSTLAPHLAGLLAIWLLAVVSPGPAFLVLSQLAAGRSRAAALGAALGIAIGAIVFAALTFTAADKGLLLGLGFAIELGWYVFVAFALSTGALRRLYGRARKPIDRLLGAALLLLGVRLGAMDR